VYWNDDGILGKKLELDQFLSELGVDICLSKELHPLVGSGPKVRKLRFPPEEMNRPSVLKAKRTNPAVQAHPRL
jgi:hypothetical protein